MFLIIINSLLLINLSLNKIIFVYWLTLYKAWTFSIWLFSSVFHFHIFIIICITISFYIIHIKLIFFVKMYIFFERDIFIMLLLPNTPGLILLLLLILFCTLFSLFGICSVIPSSKFPWACNRTICFLFLYFYYIIITYISTLV